MIWVKLDTNKFKVFSSSYMTNNKKDISIRSSSVKAFLNQASKVPAPNLSDKLGKLIFAMDATASREPCWDMACQIQADMFSQTAALGKLQVQLCHYQGYGEFYAAKWSNQADELQSYMTKVRCKAGQTQINRILQHTLDQTKLNKINALVFVGDCMEELADRLIGTAGQLALRNVPVFIFHEGHDAIAERTFKQIASITKGAYCKFDQSSADQLRALLNAVAVYAVGGIDALKKHGKSNPTLNQKIIKQLTNES